MIQSLKTPKGVIHIGDYVKCMMEYEGSKWVRVDEFHANMEDATGVIDEPTELNAFAPDEPAFCGEVIVDLETGTPVYDTHMCFPISQIQEIKSMIPLKEVVSYDSWF